MKDEQRQGVRQSVPPEHAPRKASLKTAEAEDDCWLVAIIVSRYHEVGVPVNIDDI